MRLFYRGMLVAAVASVSGCGGSSGSSSTPITGGSSAATLGEAKVSYMGNAKSLISTSTNGVTVEGLSGAAFSYVDLYPQPSLLNTMLLYTEAGQLWTYSLLTGQSQEITHSGVGDPGYGACWVQNGLIVSENVALNGLQAMYADGSHVTPLPLGGVVSFPTSSPDGSKIAGKDANGELAVMNANGTGIVHITPPNYLSTNFQCAWEGQNTILYLDHYGEVSSVPATGGSSTVMPHITATTLAGFSDSTAGFVISDDEFQMYILNLNSAGILLYSPLSTGNQHTEDTYPTIAPDNQTLAFRRQKSSTTNDGYSGIWTETISGQNPEQLILDPTTIEGVLAIAKYPRWSPYPTHQRFIGVGATVAAAASGFLISDLGKGLSGFFSFTAKTPSTATITSSQSTGNEAPLVFSVHADALTGAWWKNGYYLPPSAISTTGATDLVVSFDGTSGQITFVAPALASRGVSEKPMLSNVGGLSVASGHFSAVYDKTGKNIAPTGATTITVSSKSGKLISVR